MSKTPKALLLTLALAFAPTTAISDLRVLDAWLTEKTDRYGHNVLGGNEFAWIRFVLDNGETEVRTAIGLPKNQVFEDVEARLADVTGDGFNDVVVVVSSVEGGASLAIMGVGGNALGFLAQTPPIGRRNRWLAVAGIADFDGDGQNDIAYVETPHIGGTLRVWTMRDGELVQIASKAGYSNHRIGEDFITGGVRDCGNGPELVLPNFDWSQLMAVSLRDSALSERVIALQTDKQTVAAALDCRM